MTKKLHPAVEEALDTVPLPDVGRRRLLSGIGLGSASLAASALLAACSKNQTSTGVGDFASTPKWKFTFVNHVTTNTFFVPTQYGMADAAALLGLATPQWTGSKDSIVSEMVNSTNQAVSAKADGIAVAVIDPKAFKDPIDKALDAGIPVVSYNADGVQGNTGSNRLAYIGQDLFLSGQEMGQKIIDLMPDGGDAVGFIATPGSANIQPRIDGATSVIKAKGKNINFTSFATGAEEPQELTAIDSYVSGHPNLKGMFAVDAGSTESLAKTMQKHGLHDKGVKAGGFDTLSGTIAGVDAGYVDFTIDQQPYLQGFLPVLYLYLYKLSGGLASPPETNTGLVFVTKGTTKPYLQKTRFEGSATSQKVISRTGPIPHA